MRSTRSGNYYNVPISTEVTNSYEEMSTFAGCDGSEYEAVAAAWGTTTMRRLPAVAKRRDLNAALDSMTPSKDPHAFQPAFAFDLNKLVASLMKNSAGSSHNSSFTSTRSGGEPMPEPTPENSRVSALPMEHAASPPRQRGRRGALSGEEELAKPYASTSTGPANSIISYSLNKRKQKRLAAKALAAASMNGPNFEVAVADAGNEHQPQYVPRYVPQETVVNPKRTLVAMGQGQSSIPSTEVAALVEIYDALGGDRWRRRDGWKQPTRDPEQWFGVEVTMGHVVALELPANELSGCLPAESLARLPQLRVLDLSKNQLRGEIPAELGTLEALKRVDLSCNDLTGAIPRQIADCGQLQEMNLYQNSLSGMLPKEIGRLQSLRTLQLQHNNLCGAIPDTLCVLTQLSKVSVRGNCLTGHIPPDIGRMQGLVFLSLRNNELTGIIPPSIGSCKALEFLNLSSNQLSGPIPETLGELEDLEYLYLFDNALEGRVPGSIARLKFLKESDFRDNRLRGELPNFLDGCSSLEAVMTKWKNRKANYRHAILGDPMPTPDTPPTSSHQFLQTLEDVPNNSSAAFLSLSFGHKGSIDESLDDGAPEDDPANNSHLVAEFSRNRVYSVAKDDPTTPNSVAQMH
ncbi:hypothetical protein JM16_006888 [Phytophthora kernoviae]|uniref:Uncharacterized protein n=1 Tax=Phytophthora kernoviae TaxID=325452 RepID=A0A8T0LTV1_9STRA|nr:hypothetical protein JM16_006888 [Phytophthora kernoviae]